MSSEGSCDPAFTAVREVFEASLGSGDELGGGVCVHVDGRVVVDLWGGIADQRDERAWQRDTACVSFSVTKAVTAAAALLLASRGSVDLDAHVVEWWPQFGAHGKDAATGAHLLSHQGGLPAFDVPISVEQARDAVSLAAHLAGQEPEWAPGTGHGYHATTFGWLVGELVRRAAGEPVADVVRSAFGLSIGVPDTTGLARVSAGRALRMPVALAAPETMAAVAAAVRDPHSPMMRAMGNPSGSFNDPALLSAGWPAAGLVCTARELAGFYAGLVDGTLLPSDVVHDAIRPRADGPDRVMLRRSSFGLGFMRPSELWPVPPAAANSAFGHPGASGSLGLGDLDCNLAFGYVTNLMRPLTGDPRAYRLLEAVYAAL